MKTDFEAFAVNNGDSVRVNAISDAAKKFIIETFTFNHNGEYVQMINLGGVEETAFSENSKLKKSGLTYKILNPKS